MLVTFDYSWVLNPQCSRHYWILRKAELCRISSLIQSLCHLSWHFAYLYSLWSIDFSPSSSSKNVRRCVPKPQFPNGHLQLLSNRHLPLGPRHEHLRGRSLRPSPRALHIPPQLLHSPAGQGPRRLHPSPRLRLPVLRRGHPGSPLRGALPRLAGPSRRWPAAADGRRCGAVVSEDWGVGGGLGDAAVAGRGGGEEGGAVGDEGRGEFV